MIGGDGFGVSALDEGFKVSMRGYDRDQVDARIKELRDELSRARLGASRNNQELDAMRAEISSLNDQLTRTGKIDAAAIVAEADRLTGASDRAAREAEEIMNHAQKVAEEVLAQTNQQAAHLQEQANAIYDQAKAEAEAIIEEARLAAEKTKALLRVELDAIRNRHRDENS
jgi:cell division septum initiation protein DivIVA